MINHIYIKQRTITKHVLYILIPYVFKHHIYSWVHIKEILFDTWLFSVIKVSSFHAFNLKSVIFFEKVVFQNKLKIYLVVALDRVVLQCSVKCIEKLSGHENIVSNARVVTEWLCHWMQVPLYMWLKSLSVPQLRLLSIALKTMDRGLSNDFCLNPILCHVCVENYAYQRMRLWRVDSRP